MRRKPRAFYFVTLQVQVLSIPTLFMVREQRTCIENVDSLYISQKRVDKTTNNRHIGYVF